MHWKSWKKLCRDKDEGGLGFRVIDDFNTALLAKQLWRLLDAPDSLFARVFRGHYFRNSDPLIAKASNPSYGWKSIISARALVQEGLFKRIGNGETISVWGDRWIPDIKPREAVGPGREFYPSLTVNQLFTSQTGGWNYPLLDQLFDPKDANLIKSIQVGNRARADKRLWYYTNSGKYTVKSGYEIESEKTKDEESPGFYGPNVRPLQAYSWKVKCSAKLKHFMWQALSGCLSVNHNLRGRGINCDPICLTCGQADETIQHMLFECPPAIQTWALSSIPTPAGRFPFSSVFTNFDHLFWRQSRKEVNTIYPWILWYIWKARNDKVYNNIDRSPEMILEMAVKEAEAWSNANSGTKELSIEEDLANHMGTQCFIDGSWIAADKKSGLGWFCKQDNQKVIMGCRNTWGSQTSLYAELNALLWALKCMIYLNQTSATFFTDSTDIVNMLERPLDWPSLGGTLDQVFTLKAKFSSFDIKYIPRALNMQADRLARGVRRLEQDLTYVHSTFPVWL